MNESLLTSYSFLASLNENGDNLYNAVYIPLCKKALCQYSKQGYTTGCDENIQSIIKNEFKIDIPLIVTRKLITAVAASLSRKSKDEFGFQCFEKGKKFQFKSFIFNELEESYERERRNANALQDSFVKYLHTKAIDGEGIPTFADFINKYRIQLSAFLCGRTDGVAVQEDITYLPHANFLKFIESTNDVLYKVVRKVFVGSIIASYIEAEIDVNAKPENKVTYYIDSRIALNALDLQNEEDTKPTLELLKLIQETGGSVRILNVTVSEIHSIIDSAILNFNKDNPTTSINEACNRQKKNKTWLVGIKGQLESYLCEKLHIEISDVSVSDIQRYSNSEDTKLLKDIWFRENAAEHDVIAYLFVRERRKQDGSKSMIQKASCWFLTSNSRLRDFNIERKINGSLCEIIMPQELTSLLFLQKPSKLTERISAIGLNELIAQTISDEYPSKDLLNEFDNAIRDNLSTDEVDYKILLSAVSQQSTLKLQSLMSDNVSDKEKFQAEIHSLIAKERENKNRSNERQSKIIKENKELSVEIQKLTSQTDELSKQVDELSSTNEGKDKTISQLTQEIDKQRLSQWKTGRIVLFSVFGVILLFLLLLCFFWINSEWNFVARLIGGIQQMDEDRKDWAFSVLRWIFVSFGVIDVYCVYAIFSVQSYSERKGWFIQVKKLFKKHLSD